MLSAGGLLFSQPAPGQRSGRSAVSSPLLGTQQQDKKYARSSTGAGVYKQYKMDFASPIKTIPEDDPGYYPKVVDFNNPPAPVREYYRQLRERVKPYLRYSGKYGNSFSDKSPGGLPAPYKNRGGAAYEGIEGRANLPDGTPR